jgi:pyruvate dehydrogenase E1 component alpha subunit
MRSTALNCSHIRAACAAIHPVCEDSFNGFRGNKRRNELMPDHLESALPDTLLTWSEAEELDGYRAMLLIRRFEEKAAQLYALGDVAVLPPLSIGQEAVATGLALAADSADVMVAGPRPHGVLLARGVAPDRLMASILSGAAQTSDTTAGSTRTLQGASPKTYGEILNQAVDKCNGAHAVVMCLGDGRDDPELLFQLIDGASSAACPVVFVIENASDAPAAGFCSAQPSALAQRCEAAGLPTLKVNGLDVRQVKAAAQKTLALARAGRGCMVIEVMTYRYRGHAGMPGSSAQMRRPREETDPVAMARARIARRGDSTTVQRLKDIEQSVRADVAAALNAARTMSDAA